MCMIYYVIAGLHASLRAEVTVRRAETLIFLDENEKECNKAL